MEGYEDCKGGGGGEEEEEGEEDKTVSTFFGGVELEKKYRGGVPNIRFVQEGVLKSWRFGQTLLYAQS